MESRTMHWMTIGWISKGAEMAIKYVGGKVMRVPALGDVPSIVVVGLPCLNLTGGGTDVKMVGWEEIFITIPSYGLDLMWSGQSPKQVHIIQKSVQNTKLLLVNERPPDTVWLQP